MLRRIVFALLIAAVPSLAFAGPKEDAQAVADKFFASYTAANAGDVAALFAPDALFWGTTMPNLATKPEEILQYFTAGFGTPLRAAGSVKASPLAMSALVLSDNAVLISGIWQTERVVDGKVALAPLRVSLIVAKRGDRWQIAQFHNSAMPAAPAPAAPAVTTPPVR